MEKPENEAAADAANKDNSTEDKKEEVKNVENLVNPEVFKSMLRHFRIFQCDREVITSLMDFANNYAMLLIEKASTFAKHAGRQTIEPADIKLTLEEMKASSISKMPFDELTKLSQEYNKLEPPKINLRDGLAIPSEGITLKESNFKLKSPYQYHINYPLMDMSNRQNQMITLNTIKHQGGMSTVLRSPMPMPINLTPQRLIFKPQMPNANMATVLQNKIEENMKKRARMDEMIMIKK